MTIRYGGAVDRVAACGDFGFIRLPDDRDVFLHRQALLNGYELRAGDQVTFAVVETEKGLRAQNVEVIGGPEDRIQAEPDLPPDRPPGSGWL